MYTLLDCSDKQWTIVWILHGLMDENCIYYFSAIRELLDFMDMPETLGHSIIGSKPMPGEGSQGDLVYHFSPFYGLLYMQTFIN